MYNPLLRVVAQMTKFDFTALASRPPAKFKVLIADNLQFIVKHRPSGRIYKVMKDQRDFVLTASNVMYGKMPDDFIMKSDSLQRVLTGLGYITPPSIGVE
jgi:hypothetical protein